MMRYLLLLILSLGFVGCATQMGKTSYPEASTNFVPKRTYAVPVATAAGKMAQVLDEQRIVITSQNQADGVTRIQTDYIGGPSYLLGGGLVGSQSTRYRFSINLRPAEGNKTTVQIVPRVESSLLQYRGATTQWTDVSGENAPLLTNLENWLFEQFEKQLPP